MRHYRLGTTRLLPICEVIFAWALSADVETTQREIFHIADITVRSGLPRNNNTFGRLDAGMLPLLRMLHVQSREEIAGSEQSNGVGGE